MDVTQGPARATSAGTFTCFMHPGPSQQLVVGTHTVPTPVAGVEISLTPVAENTGQVHLHPQSNSSCWWQIHSWRFPSSCHLALPPHTDRGQRGRLHRNITEKVFNNKIGWTVAIRCRSQSDKHAEQTSILQLPGPFYTHFCLPPICSFPVPFSPAVIHQFAQSHWLPTFLDPQVFISVSCKVPLCLPFLRSPSVSVTDQLCLFALSLSLLCLPISFMPLFI